MFTSYDVQKTHNFFSYSLPLWHLYSPSVWTLHSSACLFKAQSALIGQLTRAWAGISYSGVFVSMAALGAWLEVVTV